VAGYFDYKWSRPASEKPRLNAKAAHFRQIKNNVLTRRAKLTEKLRAEETQYADELKTAKNSHKEADFEAITRRVEEIKREKETARQEVAQARKYQMWKRDNARLRGAEVERRRQEMVDIWTTQNDDKLDAQNAAYDEKLKQARQLELDREQEALEKELNEKRRLEKQEMLRNELQQQINELTAREARQNQLKNQERDLMIEQEELHQARQLQLRKERKEKQENYQKILYRQYRAQILRRAHEIERELEEDLAVLERVELETRRDENDSTEKRERARQYAQDALFIMRQKLKEERDRQDEIDYLYREQAEQYWTKREAEWAKDRQQRARLLQAVLGERQEQVSAKMSRLQASKAELVEDRENVLRAIEAKKEEIKADLETARQKRQDLLEGLQTGVEEKQSRIRAHIDFENKENELTEQTARDIEDLELEEEQHIMTSRPPVRQAWR